MLVEQQQQQQQQQLQRLGAEEGERQALQIKTDDAEMGDGEEEKDQGVGADIIATDASGRINAGVNNDRLNEDAGALEVEHAETMGDENDDDHIMANSDANLPSAMSESTATITPMTAGAQSSVVGSQYQPTQSTRTTQLLGLEEWLKDADERDALGSLGSLGSLDPMGNLGSVVSAAAASTTSAAGNVVSEVGGQDAEIQVQA